MRACLRWAWTDHEKRIHSEARHSRFCEAIAAKRKCKKQRGEIHAAQENANQIAGFYLGQFCECTKEKMMTNKTCDRCEHYMPSEFEEVNEGRCRMTLDSNDGTTHADRAYGWDYESYRAGVQGRPEVWMHSLDEERQ